MVFVETPKIRDSEPGATKHTSTDIQQEVRKVTINISDFVQLYIDMTH